MTAHSLKLHQRYHLEHHKQLGEDGIDTDLPTRLELLVLNNVLGKVFFAYVPCLHIQGCAIKHSDAARSRYSSTPCDLALSKANV